MYIFHFLYVISLIGFINSINKIIIDNKIKFYKILWQINGKENSISYISVLITVSKCT